MWKSFKGLLLWAPHINPLSANPTKWSNTLEEFVGNLPTNCLSVFDHFMGLALKGLSHQPAMFGSHSHCGRRDMFLICDVTSVTTCSKSYVTLLVQASHGKLTPCYLWWRLAYRKWWYNFLICHVTSYHHIIVELCNFMGWSPSW